MIDIFWLCFWTPFVFLGGLVCGAFLLSVGLERKYGLKKKAIVTRIQELIDEGIWYDVTDKIDVDFDF